MSNYSFQIIKQNIIDQVSNINNFKNCYIIRNIKSRFALYVDRATNFEEFKTAIMGSDISKWVDLIEEISKEDTFIYADLQKTSTLIDPDKNIFYSERHVENTNWYIREKFEGLNTPVTSFYSFKGGVGRTTATVLTALLLAREGKKVAIIDFDLEAPGLASLFANAEDTTEDLLSVKGFIDFLIDFEANNRKINEIRIDDYYFVRNDQILVGSNGGEIVIVPAISTDSTSSESYIDKLSKANLRFGSGDNYLPDIFLKQIEEKIKPDHIFIDTRTGINDIGGLVFNRYAQNIFLIFYGNRQNMFGLESMTTELKELNSRDVNFYLVNSPVPKNETDSQTEINYYIEKSYEIFCNHLYKADEIPSQLDETADHYPINIPFNEQALLLSSYRKISSLIENPNNPYKQISDIIKNNTEKQPVSDKSQLSTNTLDYLINIDMGGGASSEVEFKNTEDLKKNFYPRKDYRYIYDIDKFLILGGKGVGKTALFSVLSHEEYSRALAEFCGIALRDLSDKKWIIGLEKDKEYFPGKDNFESLSSFSASQMKCYWMVLLIRTIDKRYIPESELKNEIISSKIKDLNHIAKREHVGVDLFEVLEQTNANLKRENQTLIFIYDHLDAVLSSENNLRGKLVSALITFFYDNINRLSNIKSKIFLRQDIFDREVNDITDKVKIKNYSSQLKWEYHQLLNIIWKRLYEQDPQMQLFEKIKFESKGILGYIPDWVLEEDHKQILDKIFGKNMGGNNKAYPYNWVKLHIEDTNQQIHPRTLIKLFSESARLQKEDKERPTDRIIKSKNIETALKNKVSPDQVQELKEEYPELQNIFNNLAEKVRRSPINGNDLEEALKSLEDNHPIDTINKLMLIGVLKEYQPAKSKNEERRYHIPDLYLYGLKLVRKGTK